MFLFTVAALWWAVANGFVTASPGECAVVFTAFLGVWSVADMSIAIKELGKAAGYAGEFRPFLNFPEEELGAGTCRPRPRRAHPKGPAGGTERAGWFCFLDPARRRCG